tara:strand:- start:706 stop:1305 length:600 start_codon:yes stop_codon:yes gene_type:complete
MKISKLFVHLIAFVFLINYSNYSHANLSSEFIDTITKKASDILSSEKAKELKIEQLIQIGEQSVDIDGIGLYTLGGHRKSLNEDQKTEYKRIFREYFLKSFSNRLVEYKEAKIVVISEDIKNEKYTIVKTKLLATSSRPEVSIDWRVYTKDPAKPLIRDLIIEGLSLARTQKEEFNSIIMNNDGNISALFSSLEKFNKK